MRNTIFLLVVVFLLNGCGKKKEEVIVSKKEEPNTVQKEELRSDDAPVKKETASENQTAGSNLQKQNKSTEEYIKLKSSETSGKIGQNALVTGYVAEVNVREKVAYLNFEKRYPGNIFTAVVFPDKYEQFGDLNRFKGKNVEVRGRIGQYKGKPQIIMNGKEQIKIINN
ncbi:MAG: hypothetical protein LWX07_00935 [Bacteroidetes bacterium]|nr:hypothetical protein [Bacteroidota bacterium]